MRYWMTWVVCMAIGFTILLAIPGDQGYLTFVFGVLFALLAVAIEYGKVPR